MLFYIYIYIYNMLSEQPEHVVRTPRTFCSNTGDKARCAIRTGLPAPPALRQAFNTSNKLFQVIEQHNPI